MSVIHRTAAALVPLLALSACGYIGDPQYPALNIPVRVGDLSVIERGNHLDIHFTLPKLTTEGLAIKSIDTVDLRVGPAGPSFQMDRWADSATRVAVKPPAEDAVGVDRSVPLGAFEGQEVVVAVRLQTGKHRFSEWSNLVTLKVAAPLQKPEALAATGLPDGVLVKWTAPEGSKFRVFRASSKTPQPLLLATADKPEYLDNTAAYGETYEYYVQAVGADSESEAVGPFTIQTKDTFAPAVPTGLAATPGIGAIELSWARNTESDFRGYRVYRASADGPFSPLAELVQSPNYSDRTAESGKRYRYAVSALDQAGNESDKTNPVEAIAP